MKKVYLLGDSIMHIGYGTVLSDVLGEEYEVLRPDVNCRFAKFTYRSLYDWLEDMDGTDIVHWNNGLWDALRLFGDEPLTPIDVYGDMLRRVYKRIRLLFPNAKVIFALSTSVIEECANPDFIRYNHEIEAYNKKAMEVMNELGVEVNDLYSISKTFDNALHSDWVHFGEEGSRILADAVIRACDL